MCLVIIFSRHILNVLSVQLMLVGQIEWWTWWTWWSGFQIEISFFFLSLSFSDTLWRKFFCFCFALTKNIFFPNSLLQDSLVFVLSLLLLLFFFSFLGTYEHTHLIFCIRPVYYSSHPHKPGSNRQTLSFYCLWKLCKKAFSVLCFSCAYSTFSLYFWSFSVDGTAWHSDHRTHSVCVWYLCRV